MSEIENKANQFDGEQNIGDADRDRKTEQGQKAAFLVAQLEKWTRRALAFKEEYKDKAFEVTALEIQLMDLRAHGVDKVTARINESLKTKMLAACIERNEAREALRGLRRGNNCWCQTWVGGEHEPECIAASAALVSESAKRPISSHGTTGQAS
jgi:hypothetical protein